jgi:hypothetical protein
MIWPKVTRNITLIAIILLHIGIDGAMNMHCFEWISILGWLFFLIERQPTTTATSTEKQVKQSDRNAIKSISSRLMKGFIDLFLFTIISTFLMDAIPFSTLTDFIPYDDTQLESILLYIDDFRTQVLLANYYEPFIHPIGLHQGVWDLFTGTNDHNYRIESVITYNNGTQISLWSPDWGAMTWYEKKRWQRPMTFYENFIEAGCMDCYATYYAQQYGPNVASVQLLSHCEYPPISPPGNLFDMEYFFKPAREVLVSREPEEIYTLNYCDDMDDRCEEYTERGYCNSDNDEILFGMVRNCRYSCKMCKYDADTLSVGTHISVYFEIEEQYFDATVQQVQLVHHIRRYLLEYDEYEKQIWTTAITLRQKGFVILKEKNATGEDSQTAADSDEVEELNNEVKNYIDPNDSDLEEEIRMSTDMNDIDELDHDVSDTEDTEHGDEHEDEAVDFHKNDEL